MSRRSYTSYIKRLEQYGYITALRTPYGHVFTVTKAKKIFKRKEEISKNCSSEPERCAKVAEEMRKSCRNKEDNTVNSTLLGETSSPQLKDNTTNVPWNNKSDDYEEGVVDLDGDGSLKAEKKPQTRKYPNAPAVRKVFQEILGKNPLDWNKNTTILQACENLYTERGIEKIRNALEFYVENRDKEFCPVIDSPLDLDRKYTKLSRFKTST